MTRTSDLESMDRANSPAPSEPKLSPAPDEAELRPTTFTQEQLLSASTSNAHSVEPLQLNEARGMAPSPSLDKPPWLGEPAPSHYPFLGGSWDSANINRAVSPQEQAPDNHPDKPQHFGELGVAYRDCFTRLGSLADLDKAVHCLDDTVMLTPDSHPDKPHQLGELGVAYRDLSLGSGRFADLAKTIQCLEQTVALTPDGHPDKPHRLGELGVAYYDLSLRSGRFADLDKAVHCLQQTVALTPDGHPDKPRWLGQLKALCDHIANREDHQILAVDQVQSRLLAPDSCPDKPREPACKLVIHSLMSALDIVQHLGKHGCTDLTEGLDLDSCSSHPVSTGGFGDVYRGRLNAMSVAIKTLRLGLSESEEDRKQLKRTARELHIWSKCQHPNVLPLTGLVVFRNQVGMVSRWLEHGCMTSYMRKNQELDRCKMSVGIADGLAYLHSLPIVHGDLKGPNVLIADDGTPMLTDFGNAILQDSSLNFTTTTRKQGMSIRWAAPELLDDREGTCSAAADVYALGMTILETFTGKVPYFKLKSDMAVMSAVAIRKEIPGRPEVQIPPVSQQGDLLWLLLKRCWANDPVNRPLASEVVEVMSGITREGLVDNATEPDNI